MVMTTMYVAHPCGPDEESLVQLEKLPCTQVGKVFLQLHNQLHNEKMSRLVSCYGDRHGDCHCPSQLFHVWRRVIRSRES